MKTKALGLLVVVLLAFAAGTPLVAADVTQTIGSGSWCSPAQNGNGNVVVCNGVDPRAMERLNELLDGKDLDLRQKTAEAKDWARRYTELDTQLEETKKQLAAKGEDATLVQTAQDLLHEGKLDEARAIFDRLLQSDEANVDRAAQDHFGRATIYTLQFRPDEALPDYAQAYQYRPDDQNYATVYGYWLLEQKDYPKADAVLQELLKHQRSLAKQNPSAYGPTLALTLNNIGSLYDDTHRFIEGEAALKEAIAIRRELAAHSPAYRGTLADTLDNLGVLYWEWHRFADAERFIQEAVVIHRDLAAHNTVGSRLDLAVTLNSLGTLYSETHRLADAEDALKEAALIQRGLGSQNAAAYEPDLATTLSNLGVLYGNTNRVVDAEAALSEAVAIQRRLVVQNPAAHRGNLAVSLNNLGGLYDNTNRFADAEPPLKEAAIILHKMAAQNPAAYRPDLAQTLRNLGPCTST
jgi:tetratricopeptide (TPR) repeat protein